MSAIGGTGPDITGDKAMDLWVLSDEFKFTALSTALADLRAAHEAQDADARLIAVSLSERLQAPDRVLCLLDRKVDRLHEAASKSERANLSKAAKDIDLVAEQRPALAGGVCALEGDIGGLREAIAELVRRQMQERGEWKAAIGAVRKKGKHKRGQVSGLTEAMENPEHEREKLRETIAASSAHLREDMVSIGRQTKDGQRQSHEREVRAIADVRKAVGRLGHRLSSTKTVAMC